MKKILIIDDSTIRRSRITAYLKEQLVIKEVEIQTSGNVSDAIGKLKKVHFSVVFIDLVLPEKNDSTHKSPNGGLNILKRINSNKFPTVPTRIIGITSEREKAKFFAEEIDLIGFRIYYAAEHDFSWLSSVIRQVDHALRAESSSASRVTEFSVFTIHGINTYGAWQEHLEDLVRSDEEVIDFESSHYKYPKYAPVKYFFPILRQKIVKDVSEHFFNWIEENPDKRLVCIAHSFGTYALMHSLLSNLDRVSLSKIDSIILSGSVLKQSFPIHKIIKKHNISVYNECANRDVPLLLTNALILGTGMAGRRGFNGLTTQGKLYTRIYTGGHGVYFQKEGKIMKNNWLPIIKGLSFEPLTSVYMEPSSVFKFFEQISGIVSRLKWVAYFGIIYLLFAWLS